MRKVILVGIYLTMILSHCGCISTEPQIIFVSEKGDDLKSGSKDSPLASIKVALDKAAKIKQTDQEKPVEIYLLPGTYYLNQSLKIGPELSHLSLIGVAKASIKGSKLLRLTWEKYHQHIWMAELDKSLEIDQLIINGDLQILARYPNYDEKGGHWQGHAADVISPERLKTWKNPIGAFVHIMHKGEWGGFHYQVSGINADGEAILRGGHQNNRPENGLHDAYRMVENVFEELDSPGEWYFDSDRKTLYYWPREGQDLVDVQIEVPALKHLIEIKGSIDSPVMDFQIRGIRFEHTRRTFMEDYDKLLRSDWCIYSGGAILIEGAENCQIRDCELTNLGGNVIFVSGFNRNITVSGNHIHECGATGISFVGDTSAVRSPSFWYYDFVSYEDMDKEIGPKEDQYPANCLVENNLIHRMGRVEKQVAGVQIAMAQNIKVSHNSIYDVPRAGINIGDGTWGGHIIEYNDVFNTVLETGDHGSFNSWGRDRFWHPKRDVLEKLLEVHPEMPGWDAIHTTIIRNNRFRCDHGWDIDLDDGSSNYHIYNNLCLNGGIKLREGFNRLVENNIMVNNGFHPHVWFKNSGDIFRRNIVMTGHKDIWLKSWGKEIDYNLFPMKETLEQAQEKGTDINSLYGNPMFLSPENGNFMVEDTSLALAMGFKNFPMDEYGVQKESLKNIARQPDIPELFIRAFQKKQTLTVAWLGATLKSVETIEDQSAFGLSRNAGVVILSIEAGSVTAKSDLKKGDVIIWCEKKEINSIEDLLFVYQANNWKGKLDFKVVRDQAKIAIRLITK